MPLQKQELSVTFTEGVDTKTDYKLSSKLDTLENGFIGQNGTIQKRYGFDNKSTTIDSSTSFTGTNLSKGELLVTNKDQLLNVSSNYGLIYNGKTGNWISESNGDNPVRQYQITVSLINFPAEGYPVSFYREETATEEVFVANYHNFTSGGPSGIFTEGFYIVARRNKTTGYTTYTNPYRYLWEYDGASLVSCNGKLFLFFKEAANITVLDITTSSTGTPTTIITDGINGVDGGHYIVESYAGAMFICYQTTSTTPTTTIRIKKLTDALVLTTVDTFSPADPVPYGLAFGYNSDAQKYYLFFHTCPTSPSSDQKINYREYNSSLTYVGTGSNKSGENAGYLAYPLPKTCVYNSDSGEVVVFTETNYTAIIWAESYVKTSTGSFVQAGAQENCRLSSTAFYKDKRAYVSLAKYTNNATGVTTDIMVDSDMNYISQLGNLSISVFSRNLRFGRVLNDVIPMAASGRGCKKTKIVSSNFFNSAPSEFNGSGLFAIGGLFEFSGSKILENNFAYGPKIYAATTSAGSVPSGTYNYVAVYEYIDLSGNVVESIPGNVFNVTLGSASSVGFSIETPTLSKRFFSASGVRVALYRKLSTDVVYAFTAYGNTDNNAVLTGDRLLYTSGNTLPNTPPPLTNVFTCFNNRVFCRDEENKNRVFFSKKARFGYSTNFNQTVNYFDVFDKRTPNYEEITALGGLDDKLIVFKDNSIYAVFGDGPNSQGVGSFSDPKLVSTDVGCRDPRSVVLVPDGLMFMSSKGIYLLSRSLEVSYIGADVEEFNSQEITSAVVLPTINQIRFTTRNSQNLCFNYYYRQWSTFTNYEAQHACLWNGAYTHIKSTGLVNVENTSFLDGTTPIRIRIVMAWLKAGGIQHLQRMWRMMFIGDWKSSHKVTLNLSYDYENYTWDTYTIVPLSSDYNRVTKPSLTDLYSGANDGVYQYEVHLSRQKCQSIRFEIFDTDTVGESFSLTGLSLIIGIKQGLDKLSSNKKF